ncbi:MAG: DUF3772 domain-containing protein, partial [Pseudomonadota bacterium]|nr:DUF3772 domain-containing protein [Pseudomonadota bacterium]
MAKRIPILLIAMLAVLAASMAPAQDQRPTPAETPATPVQDRAGESQAPAPLAEADQRVAGWTSVLDGLAQSLGREGTNDEQLSTISADVGRIVEEATQAAALLTPQVKALQDQLQQLGPPPGEGEPPESEALAAKRAALQAELAEADGVLKRTRLVAVRASQIRSEILSTRRDRFVRSLTKRSPDLFTSTFWLDTASGLPTYLGSFGLVLRESASAELRRMQQSPIGFLFFVLQI